MDRQEMRRRVSTEWVETYQYAYGQLGFVKDEHARVRACNGLMVTMDKVLPFNAPSAENDGFVTADKLPRDDKIIPDEHTKPTDAPESIPGEKYTEDGLLGPAYDPVSKTWKYCPHCKRTDITHISGEKARHPGAEYQACYGCRVYLNMDGKEKDMGPARRPKA